ncbi:MAG: hypothetical protein RID07_00620, partial [Lacipirellulaceae bacterium]
VPSNNDTNQGIHRSSPSAPDCLKQIDAATRIVACNQGDHPLVSEFLSRVQQISLQADFQSRLDYPNYQASDRLIVKKSQEIVAHLRVSHKAGWFAGERLPIVDFTELETFPEFANSGYCQELLETAEQLATAEGAVVAFLRSNQQEQLGRQGWTRLRNQGHTRANTRSVLSHLEAQEVTQRRRKPRLEVASWRHFQLDSIRHLYEKVAAQGWGTLGRSEAHWQWLANRKAHDHILVVYDHRLGKPAGKSSRFDSPSHSVSVDDSSAVAVDSEDGVDKTVGYAVLRDSCIVELFTLPGYESASALLLRRACQDAIDRDHRFVAVHTSPSDPLHELLVTAGGEWIRDATTPGGAWMAKLLSPQKWVEKHYAFFHAQARSAEVPRPVEIDFRLSEPQNDVLGLRLKLTRRSARIEPIAEPSPNAIVATWQELQDLLLLNRRWPDEISETLEAGTGGELAGTLKALFPNQLFWRSPFESIML